MEKIKKIMSYFKPHELVIWLGSLVIITAAFFIFDRVDYLAFFASLIGVSALIFCAKGNPAGPLMLIVFCVMYGIISFSCRYYGEMITYVGMSLPMSVFSLVSWLKNPYGSGHSEVKVASLRRRDIILMAIYALIVTVAFYFILGALGTANLIPSTVSVATSFLAAYLTFKRSPYYALLYALNDIVLIVLWVMATLQGGFYLSVIICFAVFLVNDLYGFVNWLSMRKKQCKDQNID